MTKIEKLLDDAMDYYDEIADGVTTCTGCGDSIELDGVCHCGTESKFLTAGMI